MCNMRYANKWAPNQIYDASKIAQNKYDEHSWSGPRASKQIDFIWSIF